MRFTDVLQTSQDIASEAEKIADGLLAKKMTRADFIKGGTKKTAQILGTAFLAESFVHANIAETAFATEAPPEDYKQSAKNNLLGAGILFGWRRSDFP